LPNGAPRSAADRLSYYFRWETPADGGRLKSPHTIEIPFAFDNIEAAARSHRQRAGRYVALADRVSARGSRLRASNPNTPKLPQWPAFNAGGVRRWSSTRSAWARPDQGNIVMGRWDS
jgi:para-nitrobenzyl esterase